MARAIDDIDRLIDAAFDALVERYDDEAVFIAGVTLAALGPVLLTVLASVFL